MFKPGPCDNAIARITKTLSTTTFLPVHRTQKAQCIPPNFRGAHNFCGWIDLEPRKLSSRIFFFKCMVIIIMPSRQLSKLRTSFCSGAYRRYLPRNVTDDDSGSPHSEGILMVAKISPARQLFPKTCIRDSFVHIISAHQRLHAKRLHIRTVLYTLLVLRTCTRAWGCG